MADSDVPPSETAHPGGTEGSEGDARGSVDGETRDGRETWADWVRWGLLVAWIAMVVSAVLTGARHGSLDDLESTIADGRVTEVQISGEGLPEGATGRAEQDVYWQDGLFRRVVTVASHSVGEQSSRGDATPIGSEDAATYLKQSAPDLSVGTTSERTTTASILGWSKLPGALAALSLLLSLGCFTHIVLSPRKPWHATRWAWIWLSLTPIGAPLYLLFSGPTGPLPRPAEGHRRTPGYLTFLVFVLFPK